MSGIFFAIGEAFRGFTRRLFVSLLTIISSSVGLFIFGLFLLITLNLQVWIDKLGKRLDVEIYLNNEIQPDSLNITKDWIISSGNIDNVIYISKEDARKRFINEFGDEILKGLDYNPLPPSFKVEFKKGLPNPDELQKFVNTMKKSSLIKDVAVETGYAKKLSKLLKLFWIFVILGGGILFVGIFLIIVNTIKLAIFSRKDGIEMMVLVGATKNFIRRPFIYEGIIQGILAGFVSGLLLKVIVLITNRILPDTLYYFPLLTAGITLFGALLGGLGSGFAIKKFLKV